MPITISSAQITGMNAEPISIEIDITPGLHIFSIVGLADKEVQESRERISIAIKNLGALAPHKKSQRIIVNLAPADLKKEGPAFDLPIALGYLLASRQITFNPAGILFLGELGLDGSLRRVPGILPIALMAKQKGFHTIILPQGNGAEAIIAQDITVIEANNLQETIEHLSGQKQIAPVPHYSKQANEHTNYPFDFSLIKGQEHAKRALEIAAAGGHNIIMSGPPGGGKTILAQALPSILPTLSHAEMLEVTNIYSVAGLLDNTKPTITNRPFRNPHHTASHTAIIGGGTKPRPGEATLAHRGVLFLDEFPEFDRRVIESLRQPLEERKITVSRSQGTQVFPAHFMLVAAMNPCPCGNFGDSRKDCTCPNTAVTKYSKKISGPMLDRIDIHIELPTIPYDTLQSSTHGEPSSTVRKRVEQARELQKKRFEYTTIQTNAEMGLKELESHIVLSDSLQPIIKASHEKHRLSARSLHRLLKLTRTIADIENSPEIKERHLYEALNYRPKIANE